MEHSRATELVRSDSEDDSEMKQTESCEIITKTNDNKYLKHNSHEGLSFPALYSINNFGCKCLRKIIPKQRKEQATVPIHLPVQTNIRFQTAKLLEHTRYTSSDLKTPATIHNISPPLSENSSYSINSEMSWQISGSNNKENQQKRLLSTSSRCFEPECSHLYGPKEKPTTRKRKCKPSEVMRIRKAASLNQLWTQSKHALHQARETSNTFSSCQKQMASIQRSLSHLNQLLPTDLSLAQSWSKPSLSTSKQTLSFTYLPKPNIMVQSVGTQTFPQNATIGITTKPKQSYHGTLLERGNYQFSKGLQSSPVQSIAPSPSPLLSQVSNTEWSRSSSSVSTGGPTFQKNTNFNIGIPTQRVQNTCVALSEKSRHPCSLGRQNCASEHIIPLTNVPSTHHINMERLWPNSPVPTDKQLFTLHYQAEPNEIIQHTTHLPHSEVCEIVTETYPSKTNLIIEIAMKTVNDGDAFSERIRPQCLSSQQQPIQCVYSLQSKQSKPQNANSEKLPPKSLLLTNDQLVSFHYVAEPQEMVRYIRSIPNSDLHELVSETFEKETNLTIEISKKQKNHNSDSLPEKRRHTFLTPQQQLPSHIQTSPPCALSTLDSSTDGLLSNLSLHTDDHPSLSNYLAKPYETPQPIPKLIHSMVGEKVTSEFPKDIDLTFANATVKQKKDDDLSQRERQHLTLNQHQHTLEENVLPTTTKVYSERSPFNSLLSTDELSYSASYFTRPQNVTHSENHESSTHSFKKESLFTSGVLTKKMEQKDIDASTERSELQYLFRKQQCASIENIVPSTQDVTVKRMGLRSVIDKIVPLKRKVSTQDVTVKRMGLHSAIDKIVPLKRKVSTQDVTVKRMGLHSAIDKIVPLKRKVSTQDVTVKRMGLHSVIDNVVPLTHKVSTQDITVKRMGLHSAIDNVVPLTHKVSTQDITVKRMGLHSAIDKIVPLTHKVSTQDITVKRMGLHSAIDNVVPLTHKVSTQDITVKRMGLHSAIDNVVPLTHKVSTQDITVKRMGLHSAIDKIVPLTHKVSTQDITVKRMGLHSAIDKIVPLTHKVSTQDITIERLGQTCSVSTNNQPHPFEYAQNILHNKFYKAVTERYPKRTNLCTRIIKKLKQGDTEGLTERRKHQVPIIGQHPASRRKVLPQSEHSLLGKINARSTSSASVVADDQPFTLDYVAEPQETIRYKTNSSTSKLHGTVTHTLQNKAIFTIEITNISEQSLGELITEKNTHQNPLLESASDHQPPASDHKHSTLGRTTEISTRNPSTMTHEKLYFLADPNNTVSYVQSAPYSDVCKVKTCTFQVKANLTTEIKKPNQSGCKALPDIRRQQASSHQRIVSPANEHTMQYTNTSKLMSNPSPPNEKHPYLRRSVAKSRETKPFITKVICDEQVEKPRQRFLKKSNSNIGITINTKQSEGGACTESGSKQYNFSRRQHGSIKNRVPLTHKVSTHDITMKRSSPISSIENIVPLTHKVSMQNITMKMLHHKSSIENIVSLTHKVSTQDITMKRSSPNFSIENIVPLAHKVSTQDITMKRSSPNSSIENIVPLTHKVSTRDITMKRLRSSSSIENALLLTHKVSTHDITVERSSPSSSVENILPLTRKVSRQDITMEKLYPNSLIQTSLPLTHKIQTEVITIQRLRPNSWLLEDSVPLTNKDIATDKLPYPVHYLAKLQQPLRYLAYVPHSRIPRAVTEKQPRKTSLSTKIINKPEQHDGAALPKRKHYQDNIKNKITSNTEQSEDDALAETGSWQYPLSQQEPASYQSVTMLGSACSTCDKITEKSMSVSSKTTVEEPLTIDYVAEPSKNMQYVQSSSHRNVREVIPETFQYQTNVAFGIANNPDQNKSDPLPDGSTHQGSVIGQQTISHRRIIPPPSEHSVLRSSNESSTFNSTVLANEQSFSLCQEAEPKEAIQYINIPYNEMHDIMTEMLQEETDLSSCITTHSDKGDSDIPLRGRYQIPLFGQQPTSDEGIELESSASSEYSTLSDSTDISSSVSSVPTDEEPFTFRCLAEPQETMQNICSCSHWDLREVIDGCEEASYFTTETTNVPDQTNDALSERSRSRLSLYQHCPLDLSIAPLICDLPTLGTSPESSMSIPSLPTDKPLFSLKYLADHQEGAEYTENADDSSLSEIAAQCLPLESNFTIETTPRVEQQENASDRSISPPLSEISSKNTYTENTPLNSAFLYDEQSLSNNHETPHKTIPYTMQNVPDTQERDITSKAFQKETNLTILKAMKPEQSNCDGLPEVGKCRLPLGRHPQKTNWSFAQLLLPADKRLYSRCHKTAPDEMAGYLQNAPHSEVVAQTLPVSSPSLPTGHQLCSLSYEAECLPCVLDVPCEHDESNEMVIQSTPTRIPDQFVPQLLSIESAELPPSEQSAINTIISRPSSLKRFIWGDLGMLLMSLTEKSEIKWFQSCMHINTELDSMLESGTTETRLLTLGESDMQYSSKGTSIQCLTASRHLLAYHEATNTQQAVKSIDDDNICHLDRQNAVRSSGSHASCHNKSPCSLQTIEEFYQSDNTCVYCRTYSNGGVAIHDESRNYLLEVDIQHESTQYKYNKPRAFQGARVPIYQVQRKSYVSIHRLAVSSLFTSYDSEEKDKHRVYNYDFLNLLTQQVSIFDSTTHVEDVHDRNLSPTHKVIPTRQEIKSISFEVPISSLRPNVHERETDTAYQHMCPGIKGPTYSEHKVTALKSDGETASVPETCYLGEVKRCIIKTTTDVSDITNTSSTNKSLPKPIVNQYLLDRNEHSTRQLPISGESKLHNQIFVGQGLSRQVQKTAEIWPASNSNSGCNQSAEYIPKLKPTARPSQAKKAISNSNRSRRCPISTVNRTNIKTCPKDNPNCTQSAENVTEHTTTNLPPSPPDSESLLTHETKVDSTVVPIIDVIETKKWSDPDGNCTWYTQSAKHVKRSKAQAGMSIGRHIGNKKHLVAETKVALKIPSFASKIAIDWSDPFDNCTWYTQSKDAHSQNKGNTKSTSYDNRREITKLATNALNKTNITFGTEQTDTSVLRKQNDTEISPSTGSNIVNRSSNPSAAQAIPTTMFAANQAVELAENLKVVDVKHENEEESLANNVGRVKLAPISKFSSIITSLTTYVSQPMEYHGMYSSKLAANQDKMGLKQEKHKEVTQEKLSSSPVSIENQVESDFHPANSDGVHLTANYAENVLGRNFSGVGVYSPKILANKCENTGRSGLHTVEGTHHGNISHITNVLPSKQEHNTSDPNIKQDKGKPEEPRPGHSKRSRAINWDIFGATTLLLDDLWLGRSFLEVYNPELLGSAIERHHIDIARRGVRILQRVLNTAEDEEDIKQCKTNP